MCLTVTVEVPMPAVPAPCVGCLGEVICICKFGDYNNIWLIVAADVAFVMHTLSLETHALVNWYVVTGVLRKFGCMQ